jgi:hypothetical protein
MALVFGGRREGLSAATLLPGFAVMALTLVLAVGLISCGGSTAAPSNAGTNNSNGNGRGGGGGSTSATATFMVQAQAGNGTTNLGMVSITTP